MRLPKYPFPLLALLASFGAQAQGSSAEFAYEAIITEMTSDLQEKRFWEAMRALEPDGRFFTDQATSRAKLQIGFVIDEQVLQDHLTPHGFSVFAFRALDGDIFPAEQEPEEPNEEGDALNSFPTLEHSGDADRDNTDFRAAKEAWIEANPGAWQALENITGTGQDD